ncbi:MAG: hypothetical protein HW403_1523 [Dehalococcoidia bacterium]|nr:hypothetical protein [Dehalococcoidia bacterium]
MDKARVGGVIVCIVSVGLSALVAGGILAHSYWAVALPVLVGFLAVMVLAFWIGWTMATTEIEAPGPRPSGGGPSESASGPPS